MQIWLYCFVICQTSGVQIDPFLEDGSTWATPITIHRKFPPTWKGTFTCNCSLKGSWDWWIAVKKVSASQTLGFKNCILSELFLAVFQDF